MNDHVSSIILKFNIDYCIQSSQNYLEGSVIILLMRKQKIRAIMVELGFELIEIDTKRDTFFEQRDRDTQTSHLLVYCTNSHHGEGRRH